ncbi:hypothetical protein PS6_011762 [Mucor atramentarius]
MGSAVISLWSDADCKSLIVVLLRFSSSVDEDNIGSRQKVVLKNIRYRTCCALFIK